MNKLKKYKNYIAIIILIIIDQISKKIIINNICNLPVDIINSILSFTYCENTGVAFSIGYGKVPVFIILNIILIFALIVYYEKNKSDFNKLAKICIVSVIAGGVSNLIDRVFRGYVVDFIDITQLFAFPIFNIADIFIVVGVLGLIYYYVMQIVQEIGK